MADQLLIFKLCAIAATLAAAGIGAFVSWFATRQQVSRVHRDVPSFIVLSNLFSGGVLVAAALVHL